MKEKGMPALVLLAGPESIGDLLGEMASAVVSSGYRATVTHQPILEQAPDVLRDVEALISVVTPVGEAELAALPNARAVISPIIGYDWIAVEAATSRGVLVANGEASENFESLRSADSRVGTAHVSAWTYRWEPEQITQKN